jgi:hypothetical protein
MKRVANASFHRDDLYFLEYNSVYFVDNLPIRRNMWPSSSVSNNMPSNKPVRRALQAEPSRFRLAFKGLHGLVPQKRELHSIGCENLISYEKSYISETEEYFFMLIKGASVCVVCKENVCDLNVCYLDSRLQLHRKIHHVVYALPRD